METDVLSDPGFFSYFTAVHHCIWFSCVILTIILIVHFITRVEITRLLWLMYGTTILVVPLFYAFHSGETLRLEYLRGSFTEIVTHIASFCVTYPKNRPLTIEMIIIFLGMIIVGFFYTRSWKRSLCLGVSVHIFGNLLAIQWFGPKPHKDAVFEICTEFAPHQFMAIPLSMIFIVLSSVFIWRAGWFNGIRRQGLPYSSIIAAIGWMGYLVFIIFHDCFTMPFDILTSGLFIPLVFFLFSSLGLNRKAFSTSGYTVICIAAIMQLAIIAPTFLSKSGYSQPRAPIPAWLEQARQKP